MVGGVLPWYIHHPPTLGYTPSPRVHLAHIHMRHGGQHGVRQRNDVRQQSPGLKKGREPGQGPLFILKLINVSGLIGPARADAALHS